MYNQFMLEIVQADRPVLSIPSKPVQKIDKHILDLIEEMKKTLLATRDPKGVGLAAAQVGESYRIFITKPWPRSPFSVFINPEILSRSTEKTNGVPQRKRKHEGCLSVNNVWGIVQRAKEVKVRYQTPLSSPKTTDYRLQTKTRTFSGFLATIIQHEVDHLNGILFTQRVLEQKNKLFKVTGKDKEGNDVFEEIEI